MTDPAYMKISLDILEKTDVKLKKMRINWRYFRVLHHFFRGRNARNAIKFNGFLAHLL